MTPLQSLRAAALTLAAETQALHDAMLRGSATDREMAAAIAEAIDSLHVAVSDGFDAAEQIAARRAEIEQEEAELDAIGYHARRMPYLRAVEKVRGQVEDGTFRRMT